MNERIKALRKQAIDICLDKGSRGNLSEEVAEKFAELIIKECGAVQHKRFCEHGDVSWDILMQHFGVEG